MEKKNFELNDDALDEVAGGLFEGLFGYSQEPSPEAAALGLSAGMVFNTRRNCLTCGSTRYRVKDFHQNNKKFRVECAGCGSQGYWDYETYTLHKS